MVGRNILKFLKNGFYYLPARKQLILRTSNMERRSQDAQKSLIITRFKIIHFVKQDLSKGSNQIKSVVFCENKTLEKSARTVRS